VELESFKNDVAAWAQSHGGIFPTEWNLLRLTEEVGELARAVAEAMGPKRPKEGETAGRPEEEIGDVIFVLMLLADELGVDVSEAARASLRKAMKRDRHRFDE